MLSLELLCSQGWLKPSAPPASLLSSGVTGMHHPVWLCLFARRQGLTADPPVSLRLVLNSASSYLSLTSLNAGITGTYHLGLEDVVREAGEAQRWRGL